MQVKYGGGSPQTRMDARVIQSYADYAAPLVRENISILKLSGKGRSAFEGGGAVWFGKAPRPAVRAGGAAADAPHHPIPHADNFL